MQRLQLFGGWSGLVRTCGVELPGIRTMLPSAVRSVMTCTQHNLNQGQLMLQGHLSHMKHTPSAMSATI